MRAPLSRHFAPRPAQVSDRKVVNRIRCGFVVTFYVRIIVSRVPEGHPMLEVFSEDRNYPVLAVDPDGEKILLHDNRNRLRWLPMKLFDFVRIAK